MEPRTNETAVSRREGENGVGEHFIDMRHANL